jgi:putative endonuclease
MNETSDVSIHNLVISQERYYVYILFSLKDHHLYIGYTTNLKERLTTHASGKVTSTKDRRPLKLIHYEYFISTADAKAREKFLKSGFGRDQLKSALKRTLINLPSEFIEHQSL